MLTCKSKFLQKVVYDDILCIILFLHEKFLMLLIETLTIKKIICSYGIPVIIIFGSPKVTFRANQVYVV